MGDNVVVAVVVKKRSSGHHSAAIEFWPLLNGATGNSTNMIRPLANGSDLVRILI